MHDLSAATALGGAEARRQAFGPMVLAEDAEMGLVSLAVPRGAPAPRIGAAPAPDPGRWIEADALAAFWIAPGQWMIEAKGRAEHDLEREVSAAFPNAILVEQTDAFVVYEIRSEAGPALIDRLLEKLVNIDPARLGPGGAVRTGLEHMSVIVIRRSPSTLGVLGTRSMAASLWHALETALRRLADGG